MLSELLFQCRSRSAVLRMLFVERRTACVSELARLASLTPRSVAQEVKKLAKVRLVREEAVGGATVVRANFEHPAAPHLAELLALDVVGVPAATTPSSTEVREALASHGAPLLSQSSGTNLSVEDAVVQGLEAARDDGTLLKVLPVVLAKHWQHLDWPHLKEAAKRHRLKAELGMLVELTGEALSRPELSSHASDLFDRRRKTLTYYPDAKSSFERRLADAKTPAVARRWGFLMNMTGESVRDTVQKHLG